ncbi:MAG: hypothetical protein HYX53_02140 [Chloroflexi bacterium]|nr:hypothetical protein [Chloroflexota bacterium]
MFVRIYTTVAELTADATVAGIVEIDRVGSFAFKRIPMTRVTGRIVRVAKGSISEGSQVTFVYDGPAMSAGQQHIVFLRPNQAPAASAEFAVVGGLMGDFPISSDGIIRHDARVSLDDPALVVLRSVNGRSADEVFQEIRR